MDIRRAITIVERQGSKEPEYFYHVSAKKNLASIRKKGLVANHQGAAIAGNYAEGQWESLEGVYMTDRVELVDSMLRNREDLEDWLVVVIEGTHADMIPDEDIIDIVLDKAFEKMGSPEDWYDEDRDGPITSKLAQALSIASGEPPNELCRRMAWNWLRVHHEGDEAGDENWTDLKSEFIKKHRAIKLPGDDRAHSVRHPGHIGFEGHPRIVAIASPTAQDTLKIIGKVALPAGAIAALDDLATGLCLELDRPKTAAEKANEKVEKNRIATLQAEALELAKRCFPGRDVAEMKRIIANASEDSLERQMARMREEIASRTV